MGQISGGMLGIGRASQQGGAQVGVMDRQMRAFGTTLRYALAGTAVFAAPAMVRNLSQVQEQLGLMSAIGQTPGGLPIIGKQLEDLATSAQKGSVDAITPLSDFNDAIINFLSTVQNVPEDQISPIVTDIARAAKLSQITAEDATKAFTTMSVAFGRPVNKANIHTTAQQFFALTKLAPGGATAGGQIIQQMGQLAQVTRLAGGNQANLFGLLLSGLRTGIPPSQLGRGLQFFIQTLGLPGQGSAESQQALASVGIRPGIRMPLTERISRVFNRARQLSGGNIPNIGKIAGLDEATLDQFDTGGGGSAAALKDLGITGPGATFLGQAFHRIHALRTALALLGQFNRGTYQEDLRRAAQIQQNHVADINNLDKQWQNFARQAKLSEAGKALSTLGLQVARIFQPLFNLGATGITGVTGAARRHPDATQATVFGTLGILGLLGASRLARGRGAGLGGLLRFGGRALPAVATGENLLTGETPTGTATHPLFVIVLNQLGGGGGIRGPRGGGGMIPGGGGAGGARRIPPLLGFGLPAISAAALLATPGAGGAVQHGRAAFLQHFYPSLFSVGVRRTGRNENMDERAIVPRGAPNWIKEILQTHSVGVANRMIRDRLAHPRISTNAGSGGMFGAAGAIEQQMRLTGVLTLDIDYNQPDGTRKKKKVHVRMDNWGNGSHPQHRGQNKAKRR